MNIIKVGSVNPVKVSSVEKTLENYDSIKPFRVRSIEVPSGISDQPLSLSETIRGAKNRAKGAFIDCRYSLGIESGLMEVPYTKTGYMDLCACAIYDGEQYHIGLSSMFEPPREMVRLVLEDGMNLSEATSHMGLSHNERIGYAEGLIGLLTKNRVTRRDYTEQAIKMAMIHLENPTLY